MTPTVGRIVHYQSYGTPGGEHVPAPQAAIVTAVKGCALGKEGCLHASLAVFYDNGLSFKADVPFAEQPMPGHWNWPPRV